MKTTNKRELEDNFIAQKVEKSFGFGEEQLEQELDRMTAEAAREEIKAPAGELERIAARMDRESGEGHKVRRIRNVVKVLVAAAVLGAMVVGGSMWVGAKRYYVQDVRDREDMRNAVVFNNNEGNIKGDSEVEEAYTQIKNELRIKVLELSYLPEKMIFRRVTITSKKSVMEFSDGNNDLFLVQGLNDKPGSLSYASDARECQEIYNVFLDKNIWVYQEELENGETEFGIRIIEGNTYYILYGAIDIEEFKRIVKDMKVYEE